ncbi:MAG: primosomal protein N' [Roseovarius sp.]|nr:primosomal protein N' [Roseovarius sp.]
MLEKGADHFAESELVSVLAAQPLGMFLDYRAPEGGCRIGSYVIVPLGPRRVLGVVWGPGEGEVDVKKVKSAIRVLEEPPMRDEMREFLTRAGRYTLTPLSAMLRLATRAPGLELPQKMLKVYLPGHSAPDRVTDARRRVMDVFSKSGSKALMMAELRKLAGVSSSVVKSLAGQGVLEEKGIPRDAPYPTLDPMKTGRALDGDQRRAADALCGDVIKGGFGATLLRGVTGSGKTEVYLEAIAETLRRGRQALVLMPEIALTSEFIDRVESRFGGKPAEWHSGVAAAERRRVWKMTGRGKCKLVVGARSALFLPFSNLGLIVVDEEHDSSYKQEDGVIYNARDLSVLRASICGAQAVLSSATPSLETWSNAKSGKYRRLDLNTRYGAASMPELKLVDMRECDKMSKGWISPELREAVRERLSKNEQTLLFLNRRGYAPVTLCRACGQQIGCRQCDSRMTEHRFKKRLVCHQCGETMPMPKICPSCGAEDRLAAIGPGVERIMEEASALFPEARATVLSSDVFESANAMKEQVSKIAKGEYDIVIGTQMVAKGHNFPNLTLVGVIDSDLGLQGCDLRAAERTFQLIRQVAGRAGRAEKPGMALLQTYQTEHPVIQAIASGSEEDFWNAEADARKMAGMPPYGNLAGIILSSTIREEAIDVGRRLAREDAPLRSAGARVFGPAPAPIAQIRGRHRVRLLVMAPKGVALQSAVQKWVSGVGGSSRFKLTVDIDPYSFL